MKKGLLFVCSVLLLSSCSTNTKIIKNKNLEDSVLDYNYACLGYRRWTQNEIVDSLKSDSIYVYSLNDVKSYLAVYIPEEFKKLDDNVKLSNHSFLDGDYLDGRHVFFNKDKEGFSSLLTRYDSIDDINFTTKHNNKKYYLDLIFAEKEIEYIYNFDTKENIDIKNTILIRNPYKVVDEKLVRPSYTIDITPGLSQDLSEFYYTDIKGTFYGKSSGKDNDFIGNAIDEYSSFEVNEIDGKQYIKYPMYIGSEHEPEVIAQGFLKEYYDDFMDDYIYKDQYFYCSLDKIKEVKGNNVKN